MGETYIRFTSEQYLTRFLLALASLTKPTQRITQARLSSVEDFMETYRRQCALLKVIPRDDILQTLQHVDFTAILNWGSVFKDHSIIAAMEAIRWTSLVHVLDISRNKVTGETLRRLCLCLADNPFIVSLTLNSNSITSESCGHIVHCLLKSKCRLKKLSLSDNPIEDSGCVMIIAALSDNDALESLHLEHNSLGNTVITKIAQMKNHTITTIDLNGNYIDDTCLQEIVKLGQQKPKLNVVITNNPVYLSLYEMEQNDKEQQDTLKLESNWKIDLRDINQEDIMFVGRGSQASVFKATYQTRTVAIKQFNMDRTQLDHIQTEITVLLNMDNPNCLKCYGVCIDDQGHNVLVVTEYLPSTLKQFICDPTERSRDLKLYMAIGIANGMKYLHTRNPPVFHLDLKSNNILYDDEYNIKISDFGLAKTTGYMNSSTLRGTAQYIAPEIYLRTVEWERKCDIYSFGILLYELWYLREAYADCQFSLPQLLLREIAVRGLRPWKTHELDQRCENEMDNSVNELILACCETDANLRPDSFKQIVTRLLAIQKGSTMEEDHVMPEFQETPTPVEIYGDFGPMWIQGETIN
jgi:hypothetical protein